MSNLEKVEFGSVCWCKKKNGKVSAKIFNRSEINANLKNTVVGMTLI